MIFDVNVINAITHNTLLFITDLCPKKESTLQNNYRILFFPTKVGKKKFTPVIKCRKNSINVNTVRVENAVNPDSNNTLASKCLPNFLKIISVVYVLPILPIFKWLILNYLGLLL